MKALFLALALFSSLAHAEEEMTPRISADKPVAVQIEGGEAVTTDGSVRILLPEGLFLNLPAADKINTLIAQKFQEVAALQTENKEIKKMAEDRLSQSVSLGTFIAVAGGCLLLGFGVSRLAIH